MDLTKAFKDYKNIAVVGMSRHLSKPAFTVPSYMKKQGYNIIPVNPHADEIMKQKSYPNLTSVPDQIDIVNIFRPSEDALPIVKEAIKRHKYRGDVKMIWLQLGISHPEAKKLAEEIGIEYIEDYCMYVGHQEHAFA